MANGNNHLVKAPDNMPIFLCRDVGDMRLGIPGLKLKIEEDGRDPTEGIYIFVNNGFTRVKVFYWDNNGFCMWQKYVPTGGGVFQIEFRHGYKKITGVDMTELLRRDRAPKALPKPAPVRKAA